MRIKFPRFVLYALVILLPLQSIAVSHAADLRDASSAVNVPLAQNADADRHCQTDEVSYLCQLGCDSCATCLVIEPACVAAISQPAVARESPGLNVDLFPPYTSHIPALLPRPPAFFA